MLTAATEHENPRWTPKPSGERAYKNRLLVVVNAPTVRHRNVRWAVYEITDGQNQEKNLLTVGVTPTQATKPADGGR